MAAPTKAEIDERPVMIEVLDALVSHPELSGLLRELLERFERRFHFDLLTLSMQEAPGESLRLCIVEARVPVKLPLPCEISIDSSAAGLALTSHEPAVIGEQELAQSTGLLKQLHVSGIRQYCAAPVITASGHRCALGFGRAGAPFGRNEIAAMGDIALQAGVAVDRFLLIQAQQAAENQIELERDRLKALLKISEILAKTRDLRQLFRNVSLSVRQLFRHDYASLMLPDKEGGHLRIEALDFDRGSGLVHENIQFKLDGSPAGRVLSTRQPLLVNRLDRTTFPSPVTDSLLAEGIRSACWLPLVSNDQIHGVFAMGSREESAFDRDDMELLAKIANLLAIAVENVLEFEQILELKEKLLNEKRYLEHEIRDHYNADEIIGESPSWIHVLEQVESVAPTDATVLLFGETGTGKEIIARALHERSNRREHSFVKLSCATIPSGLLESELFGHEKGAFTGALAQHIGRFESADLGTLFLDEVGELPLELQPKLLRALQEQTFERLGSNRSIHVNVRIIAATNRNLQRLVAEDKFRADLFYRLSVFPIGLPALRERPEDIPLLVRYFTHKHSEHLGRKIETIPADVMDRLVSWNWPGNVRELENFIERSVILSTGSVLEPPLAEFPTQRPGVDRQEESPATLENAERQHILKALRESHGIVDGPSGAAVRLGLKRTTLNSKMRKLGIKRSDL
jgi:formate hydrogenlyase transcriptional activator